MNKVVKYLDRLEFDCMSDLATTITALLVDVDNDYPVISVYGKYNTIKELLEELIASGVSVANEIELQDYDIAHYDKEFVLYLMKNGLNIEKTYSADKKHYILCGGNISLVHEDCNSALLKYIDSKDIYEFAINYDDECEYDYEDSNANGYTVNGESVSKEEFDRYVEKFKKLDRKTDKNNDLFTTSSYSINGRICTKKEYNKAIGEIEDKYLDNMKDMLLNYSCWMDSVNEYLKMFRW